MLTLAGQARFHGDSACMVFWNKEALRGNFRHKLRKTFVSPVRVFLLRLYSSERFWDQVTWHLWIGRARNPGTLGHLSLEVFNVGGWLTHGDLAMEAGVDFIGCR